MAPTALAKKIANTLQFFAVLIFIGLAIYLNAESNPEVAGWNLSFASISLLPILELLFAATGICWLKLAYQRKSMQFLLLAVVNLLMAWPTSALKVIEVGTPFQIEYSITGR